MENHQVQLTKLKKQSADHILWKWILKAKKRQGLEEFLGVLSIIKVYKRVNEKGLKTFPNLN
jgi:hypothetical protein